MRNEQKESPAVSPPISAFFNPMSEKKFEQPYKCEGNVYVYDQHQKDIKILIEEKYFLNFKNEHLKMLANLQKEHRLTPLDKLQLLHFSPYDWNWGMIIVRYLECEATTQYLQLLTVSLLAEKIAAKRILDLLLSSQDIWENFYGIRHRHMKLNKTSVNDVWALGIPPKAQDEMAIVKVLGFLQTLIQNKNMNVGDCGEKFFKALVTLRGIYISNENIQLEHLKLLEVLLKKEMLADKIFEEFKATAILLITCNVADTVQLKLLSLLGMLSPENLVKLLETTEKTKQKSFCELLRHFQSEDVVQEYSKFLESVKNNTAAPDLKERIEKQKRKLTEVEYMGNAFAQRYSVSNQDDLHSVNLSNSAASSNSCRMQ